MQDAVVELQGLMKYHPEIDKVSVSKNGSIGIKFLGRKKRFNNMIDLLTWTEKNIKTRE